MWLGMESDLLSFGEIVVWTFRFSDISFPNAADRDKLFRHQLCGVQQIESQTLNSSCSGMTWTPISHSRIIAALDSFRGHDPAG